MSIYRGCSESTLSNFESYIDGFFYCTKETRTSFNVVGPIPLLAPDQDDAETSNRRSRLALQTKGGNWPCPAQPLGCLQWEDMDSR